MRVSLKYQKLHPDVSSSNIKKHIDDLTNDYVKD